MKKLLIAMAVLLALMIAVAMVTGILVGLGHLKDFDFRKPGKIVIQLDFAQTIIEEHSNDPFQRFTSRGNLRLLDVVRTLDHAASNEKVAGIVADLSELSMGMAQLQEVREAVQRFRASGKWAIAYADTYFSSQTGTGVYYLASAFDEIYMHPSGDVGFLGLAIEPYFLRNALDMFGVVPYMNQLYEYKTVVNMWNENHYTDAHRESDNKLIQSIFDEIVRGVAESRNMTEETIRDLVDHAPFIGREALEARLVDGFRYWDEVETLIEEKAGGEVEMLQTGDYFHKKVGRLNNDGDTVIALVYGLGEVVRGEATTTLTGGQVMAAKTLAATFRQLREDGDVDVVVFRVNSPGGSPDASATIDHEIRLTQDAGIPVVVSMGDVAASGGYYVAMNADVIIAQPMTITGSIGVAGGKFVITELLKKVGITIDEIHAGDNARLLSMVADPTEHQKERLRAMMDRIYEDFTQGVMEGRELSEEQIDAVARGRVWTGADALDIKLIDKLGGLYDSLQIACDLAELPAGEEAAIRIYPRKKSLLESLRDPGQFFAKVYTAAVTLVRYVHLLETVAGPEIRCLEQAVSADTLTAPVMSISN
ncbi:signal peptide peptidase SppA [bacterium]|nr:signal peptide peptidase SppA [candidate division CSSED10-310 bacterium]